MLRITGSNGSERRVSRTLDGCQREDQGKRRVWQRNEAVMPVESRCRLVLGVHHHGKGGNLRAGGTAERIGQQSATKTLAFECLIDSKTPHAYSGHGRMARQLLVNAGRKIGQQQTCRCHRVVTIDSLPVCQSHETGSHAVANVQGDLLDYSNELLRMRGSSTDTRWSTGRNAVPGLYTRGHTEAPPREPLGQARRNRNLRRSCH